MEIKHYYLNGVKVEPFRTADIITSEIKKLILELANTAIKEIKFFSLQLQ
jgi:hypothetical protein